MRTKELHVAFIDAIPNKGGSASVMVKGAAQVGASALAPNTHVQEMYRIRLPHNPYTDRGVVIGEGKPENQTHACIFAFGEAMQALDMNQDGCLAEAFKMRNLLAVGGPAGEGEKGRAEWVDEVAHSEVAIPGDVSSIRFRIPPQSQLCQSPELPPFPPWFVPVSAPTLRCHILKHHV